MSKAQNKVTASIVITEDGYTIEIQNHTRATADCQGVEVRSMHEHFNGSYDPAIAADCMIELLSKLERKIKQSLWENGT